MVRPRRAATPASEGGREGSGNPPGEEGGKLESSGSGGREAGILRDKREGSWNPPGQDGEAGRGRSPQAGGLPRAAPAVAVPRKTRPGRKAFPEGPKGPV